MKYCSVNGKRQTTIALNDRGLAYGDGLFTTAKIIDGQVVLLDKHIKRLMLGCQQLHLTPPSFECLTGELQLIAKSYAQAVIKVMITAGSGGSGGRGYSRIGLTANDTNVIIIVSDFPKHYKSLAVHGIDLGDSKQQIGITPMLAGVKHLNRLEQVLLRAELDKRSEDDLVVTNYAGDVVEVTCANLFYWHSGQLCTPDLALSGVNGIIRQEILNKFPETTIVKVGIAELSMASSIFICNSLMGIMPVKSYNNRILVIDEVLALQAEMNAFI